MPVRNLFFCHFPSPDFGGGAGVVGVDFFMTCTENEIRGVSCFNSLGYRQEQVEGEVLAVNGILGVDVLLQPLV